MLTGISVALIIAAVMAVAINKLARRNFTFTPQDQQGLSTLEWILLVAAVGGLATAGVIIVRNAVSGAGDQVDDTARLERIAQREVDEVMQRDKGTSTTDVNDADAVSGSTNPTNAEITERCKLDYQWWTSDGQRYPLRKWRGQFSLRVVDFAGAGSRSWCDAVPTNDLDNNAPGNIREISGLTYSAD